MQCAVLIVTVLILVDFSVVQPQKDLVYAPNDMSPVLVYDYNTRKCSSVEQIQCIEPGFNIRPNADLLDLPLSCLCSRPSRYFFRQTVTKSRKMVFVALLLLIAGVEQNPGPIQRVQLPQLSVGLINAQSVVNKTALIHDLITDNSLDLLAITETWVYSDSPDVHKHEAAPMGYGIVHAHRQPRPGSTAARGGGIALIHHENICIKLIPTKADLTRTFELLLVKLTNVTSCLTLAIVYRPQRDSRGMHFTVSEFTSELAELIDSGELGQQYIICGDLNCPGPVGTRGLVGKELSDLITSHSLTQYIHGATCRSGNLLDHILTPSDSSCALV
jgi:hypothetical protein